MIITAIAAAVGKHSRRKQVFSTITLKTQHSYRLNVRSSSSIFSQKPPQRHRTFSITPWIT